MLTADQPTTAALTPDQRQIVEWGDGPLVMIAGAGTGKTRVIVERVRWLLEAKGGEDQSERLLPEQILVLTYNVNAARELSDRIEAAIGPAVRARLSVSNFHAFGQRILTESATDADLPARPDVLDGIGQVQRNEVVGRDDLVLGPIDERDVAKARDAFEDRFGSYERALEPV